MNELTSQSHRDDSNININKEIEISEKEQTPNEENNTVELPHALKEIPNYLASQNFSSSDAMLVKFLKQTLSQFKVYK